MHLEELSAKDVRELLHAELSSLGHLLPVETEEKVLQHCTTPATSTPLYVVLLACQLAR